MPQDPLKTSLCPVCRKELRYRDLRKVPHFPFCSERCQMVDLSRWLTGAYRIPGEPGGADDSGKKNS